MGGVNQMRWTHGFDCGLPHQLNGRTHPSAQAGYVSTHFGGTEEDDYKAAFADVIVAEFAQRYGDRLAGWWFDHADFGNVTRLGEVVKAANPDAVVAFNRGDKVPLVVNSPGLEDYTAGHPNPVKHTAANSDANLPMVESIVASTHGGFLVGEDAAGQDAFSLGHMFLPLQTVWNSGDIVWTVEQAAEWQLNVTDAGGAITWNLATIDAESVLEPEKEAFVASIQAHLAERPAAAAACSFLQSHSATTPLATCAAAGPTDGPVSHADCGGGWMAVQDGVRLCAEQPCSVGFGTGGYGVDHHTCCTLAGGGAAQCGAIWPSGEQVWAAAAGAGCTLAGSVVSGDKALFDSEWPVPHVDALQASCPAGASLFASAGAGSGRIEAAMATVNLDVRSDAWRLPPGAGAPKVGLGLVPRGVEDQAVDDPSALPLFTLELAAASLEDGAGASLAGVRTPMRRRDSRPGGTHPCWAGCGAHEARDAAEGARVQTELERRGACRGAYRCTVRRPFTPQPVGCSRVRLG